MMTIMVGCAQSTDKAQAQSKSAKKQQSARVHDTIKAAKTAPQPKRTGKSRIVEGTYESAVLGAPRDYTIYLPKSYDVEPDRQYPILYLLHGMLDDNHCWVTRGGLQQVADELMAKGTCREMIIVTPCAGGEANKDWQTLNLIFDALLTHRLDRRAVLVALGGGVIGDMTGFAAAVYR